jgi:hypothetical protein
MINFPPRFGAAADAKDNINGIFAVTEGDSAASGKMIRNAPNLLFSC